MIPTREARNRSNGCSCEARLEGEVLVVDAGECPGRGDLSGAPACRATAVAALAGRDARAVRIATDSGEHGYGAGVAALLTAAGRFADAVADRDEDLARLARRDPPAAAARATALTGPVADLAAETGLSVVADHIAGTTGPFRAGERGDRTGEGTRPSGDARGEAGPEASRG